MERGCVAVEDDDVVCMAVVLFTLVTSTAYLYPYDQTNVHAISAKPTFAVVFIQTGHGENYCKRTLPFSLGCALKQAMIPLFY